MNDEIIENWLKIDRNYGYGWGYDIDTGGGIANGTGSSLGDGHGFGNGTGAGVPNGTGDGVPNGTGDGVPNGTGVGFSFGNGYGNGTGTGSIYGTGVAYGFGAGNCNGYKIYEIDDVPTIIIKIKNNIAQGYIVNYDLSLEKTYIVKGSNMFAHGKTIKEAFASLQEKIFDELDPEEKINEFRKVFKSNVKYRGHDFFKWHHILTGSCLQGRLNFVKNKNIDLDKSYTVKEFIEICQNDYGSKYIKELKKYYNDSLTYNELIKLLKIDGCNTKKKIISMFENASIDELEEFRNSIDEEINRRSMCQSFN